MLGSNPNPEEVDEFEEPDPATWRTIEVEQIKPSGKRLYLTVHAYHGWRGHQARGRGPTRDLASHFDSAMTLAPL